MGRHKGMAILNLKAKENRVGSLNKPDNLDGGLLGQNMF
jgi:hypothetical protein